MQDQQQVIAESKSKEENSMAYKRWRKYRPRTTTLVQSSLLDVATKLDTKDLMAYSLYNDIVSLSSAPPEGHRTTLLFQILERRLRTEDELIIKDTWNAIMEALKTEWKDLAAKMEQYLKDEKRPGDPEARVLKSHKEKLILLIQGSLVTFAENVWSNGGLSDDEKHQVIDQNHKWEETYVCKMLDEVEKQIKEKPSVLKEVIGIFRRVGGPLTDLADALDKQAPDIN